MKLLKSPLLMTVSVIRVLISFFLNPHSQPPASPNEITMLITS